MVNILGLLAIVCIMMYTERMTRKMSLVTPPIEPTMHFRIAIATVLHTENKLLLGIRQLTCSMSMFLPTMDAVMSLLSSRNSTIQSRMTGNSVTRSLMICHSAEKKHIFYLSFIVWRTSQNTTYISN